jgi:acetyltransferase-like isoleucine patch superfamily enzyme
MSAALLRQWAKGRRTPLARFAYASIMGLRGVSFPVIPGVHAALYAGHRSLHALFANVVRILWTTPLFQSRLVAPARGLYLYGGMPLVLGPVHISLGPSCRVSGQTTISGRSASRVEPRLSVGRNCDIGWQTTIAVGGKVTLGNNVRIAGRAFLAGYPGHPLDPAARASGAPDTDDQVGDIVLEDDVWLATGVTVCAGVRIGRGSVIAAGSVVTKDVPAGVLVAGVPARVIRAIA